MRKFLCGVVAVCAVTCMLYQGMREETFVVPASELSKINEHFWGNYVEVVYNGETYVGDCGLFDMCHATLESVTLRKTGVSNDIVATEFKEVEY